MPIRPAPSPNAAKPTVIQFRAQHIHTVEQAVRLEISYRQNLNEIGIGSQLPGTGLEQLLPRLDTLKSQVEAPFEFVAERVESYGLAMSLCRARFVLKYPPDKWETDLLARFAENSSSQIREGGFTIDDIDSALEPISQEVSWADDLVEYFFYIKPPSETPEDKLINEIARQGEKEHVMREIAARRDPNHSLSVYENPEYYDVEGANIEEQAAAFIESWDETRANLSEAALESALTEWEHEWGLIADEYLSRVQPQPNSV
jgi:hypothetical protein